MLVDANSQRVGAQRLTHSLTTQETPMPYKAANICGCGTRIPSGRRCPCEIKRTKENNAHYEATRPSASKRGYDHEWRKARTEYLQQNTQCRMCRQPATLVDHVLPHRGNKRLFWNKANWQPLCTHCHASRKQSIERSSQGGSRGSQEAHSHVRSH